MKIVLNGEAETVALAQALAPLLVAGDIVCLSGDLGAGKSVFARALIRARAGDQTLDVPSPTFTLVQGYDTLAEPVIHSDFYRLETPDAALELGLDDAASAGIVLVEWPDRGVVPDGNRIDLSLSVEGIDVRIAEVAADADPAERIRRAIALQAFLRSAGWGDAERTPLQGDASTRRYERLAHPDGRRAVLMDAPKRPDGEPIRDGLPYSRIAHLAEEVSAFVAICEWLQSIGLCAPDILARDLDQGFLLTEDLGQVGVRDGETGAPIEARYRVAVEALAALHGHTAPQTIAVGERVHTVPAYDQGVCAVEISLFVDWFAPFALGRDVSDSDREAFLAAWTADLAPFLDDSVLVLRDFHSPNLIWRSDCSGLDRVGLIDVQDALRGHPAYDVASLAQDARVRIPPELEQRLVEHYVHLMEDKGRFDRDAFRAAYAVFGAQRLTKVLGIFVRLNVRDGKPAYLRHIPHLLDALERNLASPALTNVAAWHARVLPIADMREAIEAGATRR